jgi:hypothetical protein
MDNVNRYPLVGPFLYRVTFPPFLQKNKSLLFQSVYSAEENRIIFPTCNLTKKHFATLFFISLRYVTILKFFVTLSRNVTQFFRYFSLLRYVTFRLQVPADGRATDFFFRKNRFFSIKSPNSS